MEIRTQCSCRIQVKLTEFKIFMNSLLKAKKTANSIFPRANRHQQLNLGQKRNLIINKLK